MNETKNTPLTDPEATEISARIAANCFCDFLEDATERSGPITEQPEVKPLLDALREIFPEAKPEGRLAQFFICYAAGLNRGVGLSEELDAF